MRKKLPESTRAEIDRIIRDHLGEVAVDVRMKMSSDEMGEECLYIHVFLDENVTEEDHVKFVGLTMPIRRAMGEELEDIFPYIRPRPAKILDRLHA